MGVSSPLQHSKESLCFEAECERAKTTHEERIRKHSDWIIPLRGPKLGNFAEKTDKTLRPRQFETRTRIISKYRRKIVELVNNYGVWQSETSQQRVRLSMAVPVSRIQMIRGNSKTPSICFAAKSYSKLLLKKS